jgi:hypothetical protein
MLKTVSSTINAIGAINYKGTWNASTNDPTLVSSVGTKGDYYVVSTAGSTNLNGTTLWGVGDWAVFNGSIWQKVDGGDTSAVTSLTVTSLTGYMYANNSSPVTASLTIPNSGLANNSSTIGNTVVTLGSTVTSLGNLTLANVTIVSGRANLNSANISYSGISSNVGSLSVGGPLSNTDIGLISSFVGNASTYSYVAIQNSNSGNSSYASISTINDGFNAYSDLGTNSTTYDYIAAGFPNNPVSAANASFLVSYSGNLAIGTWNSNSVHFLANASSATTSAMSVNPNNTVTIASLISSNVAISGGTMNVSNVNSTANVTANATFLTSSLPLVPEGYVVITLNGVAKKIPYYSV